MFFHHVVIRQLFYDRLPACYQPFLGIEWVLTVANAAGTNGLKCLPKHGGARDSEFLVTHSTTDLSTYYLASTISRRH
jgi:hypothetical protein